jgi:hypothetical protein
MTMKTESLVLFRNPLFNSPSCWEKLGNLLTHGCQVLRLEPGVPELYRIIGRQAYPIRFPYSGHPKDTISPYNLSTMTLQLPVLQKAPDVHHISTNLPAGLLHPVGGLQAQDAEMSFIHWLRMSNLTSLHLVRRDEPFDDEYPEDVFSDWACYWAKEEGWMRIAGGRDACTIDMFTSQLEDSQCESGSHTLLLCLMFGIK